MNTPEKVSQIQNSQSRREFLRKTALLTAGFAALGFPWNQGSPPKAFSAQRLTSKGGGIRYALDLQGNLAGPLASVDSGFISGQVAKAMGPEQQFKKHLAGILYEDITIQFGSDMAPSLYQWIQQTINGQPAQMNGAILTTNAMNQIIDFKEFQNAFITEIAFPALDASSNAPVLMGLKIQPGQTVFQPGNGAQISFPPTQQFKHWLASNFRLEIDGLEQACGHVIRIDSLIWKQSINNQGAIGAFRSPQNPVGPSDAPNLVITLPQSQAEPFAQWFRDFVIQGQASDNEERNGRLEYLGPDRQTPLLTVDFENVGIFRMSPIAQSNMNAIPLVKVEMYCERLQLTQSPSGGSSAAPSGTSAAQSQPPPTRPKSSIRPLRPPSKNFAPRLPQQKKQ